MGKIFISHSSVNNAEALGIHDWLTEQGWGDVFLDLDPKRGLVAGDRWQAALKAAAEQCELILIVISPDWAKSRWCLAEFLLAKQMNKQILGVVVEHTPIEELPVELTAEWQLVDLSASDTGWSTTISPPRYEPETTVSFSGTGLARLRAGLEKAGLDATTFLWPPPHDLGRAPYRGLLPLDHDDAGIFFGRDGAIVLTLDALRGLRAGAAPRFATILGASGAGKSSFLRAGMLPRLHRDSRHFYVLPVIRPERAALTGEHGFAAMLEAALRGRNITRNRADIRDAVKAGADAVAPLLRDLAIPADLGDVVAGEPPTLVIAVDQAEELLSADNAEAGAFLALLADLGRRDDPPVLVIFTVRSDSFDALQSRPELASTQPHHLIDLPPVPAGSFGDIIRGPARRVTAAGRKLHVDETLVDALLGDIEKGGTKDALPLLAFTLERLYTDYGADGDLQLAEYERLGRIRGAIEAAVEQALARADDNPAIPRDRAARLALLRRGLIPWLAGIDPATGSPRRRVARLAEVPEEARPLIELMVKQRLLATDVDTATKERTIEPAHEALLRQWGALDGWLAEDSADLAIIEALRRAATEWEANARAGEFIAHRGARLEAVEQVAAGDKFASYLTSVDHAYLGAAREAENAALRKARAARTRLTIAASIVGIVLVAGATAGWFIWQSGEAARTQASASFHIAQSEAALRDGRFEAAALAALKAYDLVPGTVARTAAATAMVSLSPYAEALVPSEDRLTDSAWLGADSGMVLTTNHHARRLDLGKRTVLSDVELPASPPPIGFAGTGERIRIVYSDGSASAPDGAPLAPPAEGFAGRAGTLVSSADGRVLALTGLIGDVLVRDCRNDSCRDRIIPGDQAGVVAIRPDGSQFAVIRGAEGNDGTGWSEAGIVIDIYDGIDAAPRTIAIPTHGKTPPYQMPIAAAWSYAGNHLAITNVQGGTAIYDLDAATMPISAYVLGALPGPLAWSPTAEMLAVPCGQVPDICVTNVKERTTVRMSGHRSRINSLRFNADGDRLLSTAVDEPIRLWSLEPDRTAVFEQRIPFTTSLTALDVDRSSGTVAVGTVRGEVYLWTAEGKRTRLSRPERPDQPKAAAISSLAFLADGRLAAVEENQQIAVWSIEPGAPRVDQLIALDNLSFSRVAAVQGDIAAAVPLSDKSILALASGDLAERRVPADTSMPLDQWGMVAAPDPQAVFISYSDGTIRERDLAGGGEGSTVFDAASPVCGAEPTRDNNGARSLDVSADGKWLVATRSDSMVILHNLADPASPLCLALPAPDSKTVAFSPDGSKLAILSATDRLYVFDLARPDEPLIMGAPAVSPVAAADTEVLSVRQSYWLAWRDSETILVSASGGHLIGIVLDPARWRARVDSLLFSP